MRISYIALLVILAVLTTKAQSGACISAPPGPPCQEYWQADAVFIAKATRVVRTPNERLAAIGPYNRATVYFSIEEIFKGIEGSAVVFDLGDCSYYFVEGERYLVYAKRNPYNNDKFDVPAGHTRTTLLANAGADLEYIRGIASAEPGTRIFGEVTQSTFNVKENTFDVEVLKNVTITLEGNNRRLKVVSDSKGRYEFKRLPAGTYRLRARVPANLDYDEQEITVSGRGCVLFYVRAMRKT